MDHRDALRIRAGLGIFVVHAVEVRQNHERIRADQRRDNRRERVVVAEIAPLELIDRHGVVLVDDWHDSQLEQGVQGRPGSSIGGGADQVIDGQQYLSDPQPVAGKT